MHVSRAAACWQDGLALDLLPLPGPLRSRCLPILHAAALLAHAFALAAACRAVALRLVRCRLPPRDGAQQEAGARHGQQGCQHQDRRGKAAVGPGAQQAQHLGWHRGPGAQHQLGTVEPRSTCRPISGSGASRC